LGGFGMRFPQDFIERVRDANNLVEIIEPYTQLKRSGDRLMGRCPFPDHAEKTASFSVSESKQVYHCFGCKKSGNVFTFLESMQGLGFTQALEFLAKRAGIPMPTQDPAAEQKRDQREFFFKINKAACEYFQNQLKQLPEKHPTRLYIEKRGLTSEVLEKFQIGVSLENWEGLVNLLAVKKVPMPMAELLGLVRKKKANVGSGYFDLFRERLMFPIISVSGEVLGFGGRTYADAQPKYLNSPETPVFHKGRTLYGLHETGRYIRAEDHAIVVEGYMDAVTLYGAGIKNVVAILGTAFTSDHAKNLKKMAARVTMLLDGDSAGIAAAERALPIALQEGLFVKGLILPEGQDPDDFIRKEGASRLTEAINSASELFQIVVSRWLSDFRGSMSEKVGIVRRVYPLLKVMSDDSLRRLYIDDLATRLDVSVDWLNSAFREQARVQNIAQSKTKPPGSAATAETSTLADAPIVGSVESKQLGQSGSVAPKLAVRDAPRDEALLLSLSLHSEDLLRFANESGVLEMLSHEGVRQAFERIKERYGQSPDAFDKLAASLASELDHPGLITMAFDVISPRGIKTDGVSGDAENPSGTSDGSTERKLMAGYLNSVKRRFFDQKLKLLANQMRNQPAGAVRQEMLEQFMNIQKARHSLEND